MPGTPHMTNWKSSQPQDKWKEISLELDALGSALKEKTHTWNKSCKESQNRNRVIKGDRNRRKRRSARIQRKGHHQENTINNFVKKNTKQMRLVPGWKICSKTWTRQKRKSTILSRLCREINEYMHSWDQELGRPCYILDKVVVDDAKK